MRKIFFNNVLLFLISTHASAQCWQSISSSVQSFHNVGIQTDGTLWTWGNNADGQLGDGTTTNRTVPTQVGTDTDWVYVVAGNNATYAIKQNGTLWAWGGNDKGQLSDGTTTPRLLPAQVLPGTTWNKIYAGFNFIVAQKTDGTLWSCGEGTFGQLGNPIGASDVYTLTQISTDTDWLEFTCGTDHTLLFKNDHTVWGFGDGTDGRLATGTDAGYGTPTQLTLLNGTNFTHAISESVTSIFRKNDGTIWGVGQNVQGSLGIGGINSMVYIPQQEATAATDWRSLESGSLQTMALKTDGSLWATGLNSSGQLGLGTTTSINVFAKVGTATNWSKVRCGRRHTLALDNNGTLWAWGDNTYGQLGDGTTTSRLVPTQIGAPCSMEITSYTKPTMHLLNNPVTSFMQLAFDRDGTKNIRVYNSLGVLLDSKTSSSDFITIDVSSYASGVYLLTYQMEEAIQTIKIIKN